MLGIHDEMLPKQEWSGGAAGSQGRVHEPWSSQTQTTIDLLLRPVSVSGEGGAVHRVTGSEIRASS